MVTVSLLFNNLLILFHNEISVTDLWAFNQVVQRYMAKPAIPIRPVANAFLSLQACSVVVLAFSSKLCCGTTGFTNSSHCLKKRKLKHLVQLLCALSKHAISLLSLLCELC